jgi:hypothetical protein
MERHRVLQEQVGRSNGALQLRSFVLELQSFDFELQSFDLELRSFNLKLWRSDPGLRSLNVPNWRFGVLSGASSSRVYRIDFLRRRADSQSSR